MLAPQPHPSGPMVGRQPHLGNATAHHPSWLFGGRGGAGGLAPSSPPHADGPPPTAGRVGQGARRQPPHTTLATLRLATPAPLPHPGSPTTYHPSRLLGRRVGARGWVAKPHTPPPPPPTASLSHQSMIGPTTPTADVVGKFVSFEFLISKKQLNFVKLIEV